MSRPRERARPLIPITIEHADCLHRFSTASPVDKLAVDRRRPPCIRKVQTVALAVVPEKATKWSPARGPRPLRRSGPDAVRNDGHPGEPGELPSGDQTLAGWWHAIARRPGRAPRSTVTIDLECKKDSTETPQALMRGTRSSVMGKIIAVAARQDTVIESPMPSERRVLAL
jgi:hypothetical protein